MLEIIAIISVSRTIRAIALEKGLKPSKYIIILIALWIGFEMLGGILGALLFGPGLESYLIAIVGAGVGGYLGYNIAQKAEPYI
jgi:small-conductance mechanosensitive channel